MQEIRRYQVYRVRERRRSRVRARLRRLLRAVQAAAWPRTAAAAAHDNSRAAIIGQLAGVVFGHQVVNARLADRA